VKVYRVKGEGTQMTYVRIIEEREDEVHLMVTKQSEGEQRISRDRISKQLFQTCVETGYLVEAVIGHQAQSEPISA
jgi:hypothetical protein